MTKLDKEKIEKLTKAIIGDWFAKEPDKEEVLKEGKYYDPCKDCGGEDCACCDYGRGY